MYGALSDGSSRASLNKPHRFVVVDPMPEYLTTKELAELLRIKERKVYDLAASGEVPCSKAMGKLLFPRAAIDAWLQRHSFGLKDADTTPLPQVLLGSHDPLLEWALRESQCGIASFFDSSVDGLNRFVLRQGIAAGIHLYDCKRDEWNTHVIRERCGSMPVVLVHWAKRLRGLIVSEALKGVVTSIADLRGRRFAPRQAAAGAQILFVAMLDQAGLVLDDLDLTAPLRSEADAALAVLEGKVDATFGLGALAAQYRLPFVPVTTERFELVMDRREWFEPPMQRLLGFCRGEAFARRAAELAGYDICEFGTVYFNGP